MATDPARSGPAVPRRGPPVLYSNTRDGGFAKLALPVDNANSVAVLDYNNDGWMDLVFTRPGGCPVLLENEAGRQFRPVALPDCHESSTSSVAVLDYDNDEPRPAFPGDCACARPRGPARRPARQSR